MAGMQSVWLVAFLLATVRGQSVENVQCESIFTHCGNIDIIVSYRSHGDVWWLCQQLL